MDLEPNSSPFRAIQRLEQELEAAIKAGRELQADNKRLREALQACWDVIELANSAKTHDVAGQRLWNGYSKLTEHPNPIMPGALEGGGE